MEHLSITVDVHHSKTLKHVVIQNNNNNNMKCVLPGMCLAGFWGMNGCFSSTIGGFALNAGGLFSVFILSWKMTNT